MRVTPRDEPGPTARPSGARGAFEEALQRSGADGAPTVAPRPCPLALPELREAARAVPPAIWSGQVARERAVELSFGRDLAVELREAPGGIALAVRASPALARAARIDLPALVAALRDRGVTVVRAEVSPCSPGDAASGRSASR